MGKRIKIISLCLALLSGAFYPLEESSAAASQTVTVAADSVNVREGPSLSYPLITQLKRGDKYSIVKEKNDWIQLKLDNGQTGWVANWLVKKASSATAQQDASSQAYAGISTTENLRVRSGPGTSFRIIGYINKGQRVDVLEKNENWAKIRFADQQAWVSSQFIDIAGKKDQQDSTPANGVIGTVTANGLHIRDSASLNGKIVGTVNKGQSFSILAEVNNWAKIEYASGKNGWVSSLYIEKSSSNSAASSGQAVKESTVTILESGTNLRKSPSLQADVVKRANKGEQFEITKVDNQWYKIKLANGDTAYVAGWIVSVSGSAPKIEKQGADAYLKNRTIVLDPGHGGEDTGTTGARGSLEKDLTLRTAKLVYDKLKAAGANVVLTRNSDDYVSLPSRVSTARYQQADAFVSLHYDSNLDQSVRGETGYYYHSYQKSLAEYIFSSANGQTGLKNRGIRYGDFHVIRENPQKATLIELGYLSNPEEEITLNSKQFQENAASGIYNGLARYFKEHS